MPNLCPKYGQDVSKNFQDMPKICPRYTKDMPKICPKYGQDMAKICQLYDQYMPWTGSRPHLLMEVGKRVGDPD